MSNDSSGKDADKGIIGNKANIVDKGATHFDPSNPNTWTEAMREADQNIAMVMARLKNPELVKSNSTKVDLKVKLVRGNSGALILSSARNKR